MTSLQSLVFSSALPGMGAFYPYILSPHGPRLSAANTLMSQAQRKWKAVTRSTSHAPLIRKQKPFQSCWTSPCISSARTVTWPLPTAREAGNSNAWKGELFGPMTGPNLRVGTSQPGKEEGEIAIGWERLPEASCEQWGEGRAVGNTH